MKSILALFHLNHAQDNAVVAHGSRLFVITERRYLCNKLNTGWLNIQKLPDSKLCLP